MIATKVYGRMRPGPNGAGLSRKAIMAEIDASLQRLGTDYVDLYQIHRWDYDTPIQETLEALHDVVKAGKARYIGASSMHAWQFARALGIAERHGWTSFVSMQNLVNLLYREEEREMLPLCAAEGIAVIPWSSAGARSADPRLGLHQHPHRDRRGIRAVIRKDRTRRQESRRLPAAMGTLLTGFPLGIGMGTFGLPAVGSWRTAMAAAAAVAAIAMIAATIALAGSSGSGTETRRGLRPGAREIAPVIAAGLLWGCVNAGFAVVMGFAPAFFVGSGLSALAAGALVSLVAFAQVPTGPIGGWLLGPLSGPLLGLAGGIILQGGSILCCCRWNGAGDFAGRVRSFGRRDRRPDRRVARCGACARTSCGRDGPVLPNLLCPDDAVAAARRGGPRSHRCRSSTTLRSRVIRRTGTASAHGLRRSATADYCAGLIGGTNGELRSRRRQGSLMRISYRPRENSGPYGKTYSRFVYARF